MIWLIMEWLKLIEYLLRDQKIDWNWGFFNNSDFFSFFSRPDNADLRLTQRGYEAGLVSEYRWSKFKQMCSRLELLDERLESLSFSTNGWNNKIEGLNSPGKSLAGFYLI